MEPAREKKETTATTVPTNFGKIIEDFVADILITFPEHATTIAKWWNRPLHTSSPSPALIASSKEKETLFVFRHCVKKFPERFFDILYKNADIFSEMSVVKTDFLPGISFQNLWSLDISDHTKEMIWFNLQLILFSVMGTIRRRGDLGEDTAKWLETVDEEELKNKLEETLQHLSSNTGQGKEGGEGGREGIETIPAVPNADEFHSHLHSMMDGKLGKFAMELAEETAKDFDLNIEETTSPEALMQQLFKDPGKMMNLVKNIGGKLDEKIKSGEIEESELMEEGKNILSKMGGLGGLGAGLGGGLGGATGGMADILKMCGINLKAMEHLFQPPPPPATTATTSSVSNSLVPVHGKKKKGEKKKKGK